TPDLDDAGKSYFVDIMFTDDKEASKSCPLALCVPQDLPPVCDVDIVGEPQCAGPEEMTTVTLDATGSYDPEGKEISYVWNTDCVDSEGQPVDIQVEPQGYQAALEFDNPGLGQD